VVDREQHHRLPVADPAEQRAIARDRHALGDHLVDGGRDRVDRADFLIAEPAGLAGPGAVARLAARPGSQHEVFGRVLAQNEKAALPGRAILVSAWVPQHYRPVRAVR